MNTKLKFAIAALVAAAPLFSHAESSILSSLQSQGIQVASMSDEKLSEAKGAARITGQPLPSVTVGLKTYQVTWSKFGSTSDYRSYISQGSSYNTANDATFVEGGVTYRVAGDRWLADRVSNAGSWSEKNSVQVDSHLQALDNATATPLNYGWRTTSWNRPISTFSW